MAAAQQPQQQISATKTAPVDLTSVLQGVDMKLQKEREQIARAINDPNLIRDFTTFNSWVAGMQASIRTLDLLTGKVMDVHGTAWPEIPAPKPPQSAQPEPATPAEAKPAEAPSAPIAASTSEGGATAQ
ncbi:hypothetical protein [Hyphomicrobium sp.]|uniref:hypothetical protein n=1 Tax=Hyphomicrobium sp. TaxID=82 RepID=UPI001E030862|nr:hypothetical protein [Hyphomicrobium sp.]MBY0560044.1 hypothetical protein [Hyphomicrobium sp.]